MTGLMGKERVVQYYCSREKVHLVFTWDAGAELRRERPGCAACVDGQSVGKVW